MFLGDCRAPVTQALFGFGRKPQNAEQYEEDEEEEEAPAAKPAFSLKGLLGAGSSPTETMRVHLFLSRHAADSGDGYTWSSDPNAATHQLR